MRTKTFYADNEIVTDLYTFGTEWQLPDGVEYIGLYHKYTTTNEIYTGPVWNASTSKKLTKYESPDSKKINVYKKLQSNLKLKFAAPAEIYPEPTTADILKTYFTRYFIKKQNESRILEINKQQFDDWSTSKIDPIMYTAVSINWYIVGPKTTEIVNKITTLGVQEKNKLELLRAELKLVGMLKKLNDNLLQYYTDTDFIIPPDINAKTTNNITK